MNLNFEKNKLKNYIGEDVYLELKKYNAIIAGGMITSLFTGNDINDIDIYFSNYDDMIKFAENNIGHVVCHTNKATQWVEKYKDGFKTFQIIHYRIYDNAEEIFSTYDFTVCMGAYDFKSEEFIFHNEFFKHNSQRILKFNTGTSYPIISALRVQKYENKGYKISKAEMIRIIMQCMTLNVNSYDELKEHLGGMYGESYDRIFEGVNEDEFDINLAIEKIAELSMSDSYFSEYKPIDYDIETILEDMDKSEKTVVEFIEGLHIVRDGYIEEFKGINYNKKITPEEAFKDNKFYKFVKKENNILSSYWNRSFKYKVGEVVTVKTDDLTSNGRLYFNHKNTIKESSYCFSEGKVLIEVEINYNDIVWCSKDTLTAKSCRVLREVPESEWINY